MATIMALRSVEKTLEAQLAEDVKKIEGINGRVEVIIQPNGKNVDVMVYPPALDKYPKMHFWEREKKLLPGIGLDFTEKTATALVTVRYIIGLHADEHRPGSWKASGTTSPVLDRGDEVKRREEDAAEFGKTAISKIGWIADSALEAIRKESGKGKSELFLSRVSDQIREQAKSVKGKEIVHDHVTKITMVKELEPLAPVINSSKRTVHVQLLDKYNEPQMSFHFIKGFAWGSTAVEYNVHLTQKEDGSFTMPKRDLSDAALKLQETQAVNAAKKVLSEVEKVVRNYFKAVESRKD
ncbi:hypothetical protein H0N99_03370 [Candidatus Micrarchaeota archaeon]|nr:hypothetical protein [Candidatus Micrarchaeota archaeon]